MLKTASLKPLVSWLKRLLVIIGCALLFLGWMNLLFSNTGWKTPEDLVIDRQDNLIISESSQGHVLKFNSKGEQLASFGSNGKGDDQFKKIWGPNYITVDHLGQIYASQEWTTSLQKFDARGNFQGKLEIGQEPRQLLSDSQNNLYVLVEQAPFILKFDSGGHPLKSWNEQSTPLTPLSDVKGLALDQQDNLYVVDDKILKKFDRQGTLLDSWTPGITPSGKIAVDGQGRIYFLVNSYQIYEYDKQGHLLANWGGEGPAKGQFDSYIRKIATDSQDNLYAISTEGGPFVVKKFDHTGRFISQWLYGWPQWISPFLTFSGPLVGLLIGLLFRAGWRWSTNPATNLAATAKSRKPLPQWVIQGQTNPYLLNDHLDLKQLSPKQRQDVADQRSPEGIAALVAGLVLIVVVMIGSINIMLDGFSFSPLVIGLGVAGLVACVVLGITRQKLYQRVKEREAQRQELAWQVLGTMPAANQASIVGSEKAIGLSAGEVNNLGIYLVVNLPLAILMMSAFSYGWKSEWFEGWPGWLIQIAIVDGLVGMALVCLWLVNRLQHEGKGKIKLNRSEMGSFQGLAWVWLLIFTVMTFGLDSLNDWVTSLNPQPQYYLSSTSPTLLSLIGTILKYAFLVSGFFYIPNRWWRTSLNKGDYARSLRRLTYLRSICNVLTLRLLQAEILRLAGRFAEAEYLLQETLSKPLYQEEVQYLARILAEVALLRMAQERYSESMFFLEESLKLKPDNIRGYNALAEIYLWLQHLPDRALELLERAVPPKGTFAMPGLANTIAKANRGMNRAWAMAQRGQREEANTEVEQVLTRAKAKYQPGQASLYVRAGQVKELCGRDAEAVAYYQRAVELDPKGLYGQQAGKLEGEVWELSSPSLPARKYSGYSQTTS